MNCKPPYFPVQDKSQEPKAWSKEEYLRRQESIEQPLAWLSPARVLPLMALSIFFSEFSVMFILAVLPELPVITEALVDATLLLVILSPTFYLFHYRPLKAHYLARKNTVDQLLESEERLNLALSAVNDGLWDWDIRSGHLYFSPRSAAVLGYDRNELDPRFSTWEKLVHPDDLPPAMNALKDHLAGKSPNWQVEHRLRAKSGDWIWVLARGRVVERDAQGNPLRAVGTYTDISPRKQAEELLHQRQEDIRQLSRQLMATSEAEKKQIAQDLHDEFGQVLTAFQMGIEMLREHAFKDEEDYRFQCDRLLRLGSRMQKDIRNLCDRLRPVMLDNIGLAPTLEWLVGEFSLSSPDIRFSFHGAAMQQRPSPACEVVLYRICQEALNNCVKHSGADQVEVSLAPEGDTLTLKIRDNGRGVPVELLRKDRQDRWGFGLLGIHERAAAVNGQVRIASTPGAGLTIEVVVPEPCRGGELEAHQDTAC